MHIAQLCFSDSGGGAMRAAYRTHQAVNLDEAISTLLVKRKMTNDQSVKILPTRPWEARLKKQINRFTESCFATENPIMHSYAILPSSLPKLLNNSDYDLIHLHWINEETISIKDISRLNKPLIWTLHDLWAICGGEHFTFDFRWRDGYLPNNRPQYESGIDLNRWTWRRKVKHWARPIQIVAVSHWLADCVRESALMSSWPVTVIPNPLNTDFWIPVEKISARQQLNLPEDVALLLFGCYAANSKPHKGFDLLLQALPDIQNSGRRVELVLLGEVPDILSGNCDMKVHNIPRVNDDSVMRTLYNAVDVVVGPSRMEPFGQFASEALSCGTPVAAFAATGLLDVVQHKKSGYLAKAFEPKDLAAGIEWILSDRSRYDELSVFARSDAIARFSYPVVGNQYKQLYKSVLETTPCQ